jgi:hypothetical protein
LDTPIFEEVNRATHLQCTPGKVPTIRNYLKKGGDLHPPTRPQGFIFLPRHVGETPWPRPVGALPREDFEIITKGS